MGPDPLIGGCRFSVSAARPRTVGSEACPGRGVAAAQASVLRRRFGFGSGGRRRGRLAAEADLPGERLPLRRVVRRHHRVVPLEPPPLAVLLGRHPVIGHQVPLQHLQLLAVLEADDVVVGHRAADRHRRRQLDRRRRLVRRQPAQRVENRLDQRADLGARDGVVADMRRNDLGGKGEKLASIDGLVFGHPVP